MKNRTGDLVTSSKVVLHVYKTSVQDALYTRVLGHQDYKL